MSSRSGSSTVPLATAFGLLNELVEKTMSYSNLVELRERLEVLTEARSTSP